MLFTERFKSVVTSIFSPLMAAIHISSERKLVLPVHGGSWMTKAGPVFNPNVMTLF
jgi:hypothetical protein